MALYVKDLSDLVQAVIDELKIQDTDSAEIARIKRDINLIYLDEVVPFKRWLWLSGNVDIEHKPSYAYGKASVTPGSTTVELTAAPPASKAGYLFATDTFEEVFRITEHEAGSTTLELSTPWTGALNGSVAYRIWTDEIALPTNCRETIEVWHDHMRKPLEGKGLQELRRIVADGGRAQGRPLYYSTYDYEDPSSADGESESDRYRKMKLYPAIYDTSTTLHVDYVKEALPLTLDGDEPLMALEDRIVLVYGALARAWRRARNPEESANNQALFDRKLARMAGKIEDAVDKPALEPSSSYLAKKRARSTRATGAPFTGGSSYSAPSYLKDAQIAGANLTANMTVAPGVTVDGRDISADGNTLDEHIAGISGKHAATAITVTPAGTMEATDVQAALEELHSDLDGFADDADLQAHLDATTDAHPATSIVVSPTGNLESTDAQSALAELQADIDTRALDSTVTALSAAIDGKIDNTEKGAALGVATLDSTGKVPVGQIPALALVDVYTVANIAARDALDVQEGDVAKVTDIGDGTSLVYIYNGTSWTPLQTSDELLAHLADTTGAHAASAISSTPTGNLSSTTVQAALNELQGDIDLNTGKLANVVAPSTGKALEVASTTGGFLGPRMTTSQRDAIAAPATGLEIFNTTTSKKQIYNGTAWQDVGSGSGSGINYVSNPDFDNDTASWVAYSDSAGVAPVDGIGGTPAVTIARSTTNPLRGLGSLVLTKPASNTQGQGFSTELTAIPNADRGRVLQIAFDYNVVSGTYADGDLQVYLYNIDTLQVVYPSNSRITSGVAGLSLRFLATFQTDTTSQYYRLIVHSSSTSASAYSLRFDNFSVGPQITTLGYAASDAVNRGPINITAVTTAPTKGTVVVDQFLVTRRGNRMLAEYRLETSAAGSSGAGAYIGNLPSGMSFDTNLITPIGAGGALGSVNTLAMQKALVGAGHISNGSARGKVAVFAYTATSFVVGAEAAYSAYEMWGPAAYALGGAMAIGVQIDAPIAGWSSGVQMSSDAGDGRAVIARYTVTSAVLASGTAPINFNNKSTDTHSAVTTTAPWKFVAPVSGSYRVSPVIYANGAVDIGLYKNGALYAYLGTITASSGSLGSTTVDMIAGVDYIDLRPVTGSFTPQPAAGSLPGSNHISIERINTGAQAIAATETIAASYWCSANFAASATVPINFDSREYDTHGAVIPSATAWRFNPPAPGLYSIKMAGYITTAQHYGIQVYKNGSLHKLIGGSASSSGGTMVSANGELRLLTTDYIDIRPSGGTATYGGGTLNSGVATNIAITRVGNY